VTYREAETGRYTEISGRYTEIFVSGRSRVWFGFRIQFRVGYILWGIYTPP